MPIKPENRARYARDWLLITHAIKQRAGWRCECAGECGRGHVERCQNLHGEPSQDTGKRVCLTTAHLDHAPENNDSSNLKAMCNACHLAYDAEHHAQTAYETRRAGKAVGDLFA